MATSPVFDEATGHRLFSAACFNRVWEGLEVKQRTPEEDEILIACCLASLWHWSQRPDCTRRNMSIGYWPNTNVKRPCELRSWHGLVSRSARLAQ